MLDTSMRCRLAFRVWRSDRNRGRMGKQPKNRNRGV